MTLCPSGKIAEIKGQIGSLISLGHEKDEVLKIEWNFCFQAVSEKTNFASMLFWKLLYFRNAYVDNL